MTWLGVSLAAHKSFPGTSLAASRHIDGKTRRSPVGRIIYVAKSGNDSGPGTSRSPFRTIAGALKAVSDLGPNDTIMVLPGIYNEQVVLNKRGDASGYLTLQSLIRHAALIRSPKGTYSAVNIIKDFVVVDGFVVHARGDGHGIEATFLDGDPNNDGPHHVKILNNICYNNAGSGIGVAYGDFYTIEGNICHNNCHSNGYQGSGISIYEARAISEQIPGFHNFVRNNVCSWNIARDLPGDPEPPHSDANGIIIDDFHNSQTGNSAGNYAFGTLVENNVVHHNGGKGIHVFLSDKVIVRNNTAYHNNRDLLNPATWRGELSNALASKNIWANNIAVADPKINASNTAISYLESNEYVNRNVFWYNNLTFNGISGEASLKLSGRNASLASSSPYNNILGIDPDFVDVSNTLSPNLRLRVSSPARNAGTIAHGIASTDFDGNPRIADSAIDIGAYEKPV